ncbi:hypothetical protein GX656_00365 [Candidatus Dojkabacteria bacterium]|uniref:Bacterial repeat domain-containing protein n=1 Tax=Candidatus Dojkabacteria bacterium TaxID=2099670 RepID=A0A847CZQ0_9BACT|nr:hypothetical protein [Candidatus Dojkabacteria bacterium]
MSNIRVGVGKKGIVLALIVGVLLLGGGGGYLLWRVNQEDTVAPTDSDASEQVCVDRCTGTCSQAYPWQSPDQCTDDAYKGCEFVSAGGNVLHGCCLYERECNITAYHITYAAGANGSVTNAGQNSVAPGGSISSTASPSVGYRFVKWSDNKTTATRTDTNVQADAIYTAIFEVLPSDQVTLTYIAGSGGTISGTATQTIAKGASGTAVTATPNSDYTFEKWSDNKTTATRTDTNVQVSATYTATFKSTSPTTPVNCTGFTLSCGANNTININWNLVTGAVKYIARINKAPKSDWLNEEGGDVWIALGPDVNSYVIQNAQSGVVYGVNVLAYDGPDGQTDFHPSCNMTGLGQIWDPPMYIEIACQGTSPIVVPDTGIFDNSKHTVIFGFVVLVIGLAWTWISTLPKKALFAISSTSSKIREDSERRRVENRRERLEKRIK